MYSIFGWRFMAEKTALTISFQVRALPVPILNMPLTFGLSKKKRHDLFTGESIRAVKKGILESS